MEKTSGDMLCKALDLESKALDFYKGAQARCPSRLGRAVFTLLVEDKLRQTKRLGKIHEAVTRGATLENACVLDEEHLQATEKVFGELATKYGEDSPACKPDTELLAMALDVEQACLGFLEGELGNAREPGARSFLLRAIEEERGHYMLLSDMRYYYEHSGEAAGKV